MHLGRGDDRRPGQTLVVMMGFGDAREHTADADTVAAHPHRDGFAVLIEDLQAKRVGILETKLEDLTDFHAAFETQRAGTIRAHITMADLDGLDSAVGGEITAVHEVVVVDFMFVGAGEPRGTVGDMRVDEIADRVLDTARRSLRAKGHRADIAADQLRMCLQVILGRFLNLGGGELGFQTLHIDNAIAGHTDNHEFAPRLIMVGILRVFDGDDHILQDVTRLPLTAVAARMVLIGARNHIVNAHRIRGRYLLGGGNIGIILDRRFRRGQRLDVPRLAGRSEGEGVLADWHRSEELLGRGAAHRAGHREHRDILQVKTGEDALVGAPLVHIGLAHALLVNGEGVGVLHDELAAADQAGAWAELVTVLGLDLVEGHRQVLVRGVHVLDQKGEHLLMCRGEQVIRTMTVLQTEDVLAVLFPAVGRLVRFTGQQRREMHFLGADAVDFLTDDSFDLVENAQTKRQPRPDAGGGFADVSGALQQFCGIDVRISGILAQRAQEQRRHTKCFGTHESQGIRVMGHYGRQGFGRYEAIRGGAVADNAMGAAAGRHRIPWHTREKPQDDTPV